MPPLGIPAAASLILVSALSATARAESPDTLVMKHPPEKYEVVVSATRTAKDLAQVANAAVVVRGDELRRRGTRTVAEALQDVVGLDTGEGSDNGMRLPNLGLWGLKEFDALLVTIDGVPVGGPFNPELSQIPVEEIDRIEVVKGPQGTLYGVSGFAGMVQVFTREDESRRGHVDLGGGSFDDRHGAAAVQRDLGRGLAGRLWGSFQRTDGWQDRTGSDVDRGRLTLTQSAGRARVALTLDALRETQRWGTPLPFDQGQIIPGFEVDHNYAVRGARLDHHVLSATSRLTWPLEPRHRIENTLGVAQDRQVAVRSFLEPDLASGNDVPSEGIALRPRETTVYEDARLVSRFALSGAHELVTGAALTWGRTLAAGRGFDFDQDVADQGTIPEDGSIPAGDLRSFHDRRTFFGLYAHDEWTPTPAFSLSGGGRWDRTSEELDAEMQEQAPGEPLEISDDSRETSAWSGDIAGLMRLVPQAGLGRLELANLYASWKSSFKPAAPNLSEAENASILDPERTHSVEVGLKTRALARQVALDLSWFDMTFDNLVVSTLSPDLEPLLVNAGRERFKGFETALTLAPDALDGLSLTLGYAHHDARFVRFTFVTPDGELRDVSGKKLELVPRDLFNAKLQAVTRAGVGGFAAVRHQGERPFNRRNTFFADAYTEWDAGLSYELHEWRVSVTGRNLGDDRHVVTESELGDSQFYIAPPRRFVAQASYAF